MSRPDEERRRPGLTVADVARLAGCRVGSVYRALARHAVPGLIARRGGEGPPLFRRAAVEAWVRLGCPRLFDERERTVSDLKSPPDLEMYDVKGVAEMLGLSLTAVYNLVHAGTLPSFQIGRRRKIRRADLEAYLETTRRGDGAPVAVPPQPPPQKAPPIEILIRTDGPAVIRGPHQLPG